jgi:hypothetical protein
MTEAYRDPAELEQVILRLLSQRSAQGSICPSDVARRRGRRAGGP